MKIKNKENVIVLSYYKEDKLDLSIKVEEKLKEYCEYKNYKVLEIIRKIYHNNIETILNDIISINPKDINKIIIYDINDIATSDKEIVMFESLFNIVNIELETINQGIIGNNLKSNCIIIDDNIKEQNKQFIICEDSPFD
ncbi:unknown [Acholeplasma sp. CAG:878]|nr:unknown [Acholeplasma sp. CAG:878]